MKTEKAHLQQIVYIAIILFAGISISCSTSDPTEDSDGIVDNTTGNDPREDENPDGSTILKDVTINVSDAYNTCGFGTDMDITLGGNVEQITATGIAVSVSAQDLENTPQDWIYDIIDAPQPTAGLQTLYIKGLRGNTTYYYRPFAKSSADEFLWGEMKEFTTTEEVLFGQKTDIGNISVKESGCYIDINPYAALKSVYNNVQVSLQDIVLEDFQCSISYYETIKANTESYTANLDNDKISVTFTELPPGAKVSFLLCVDCDGAIQYQSERYTVTSRKISENGIIDLSLSVDWAACNLGAGTPWETGGYYTYEEADMLAKNNDTWRLPSKENIEQLLSQCEILPVRFDNFRRGVLVSNYRNTIYLPFADTKDTPVGENGYSIGYFWTSTQYYDAANPLDRSRIYTFRLLGMTSPENQRYELVELNRNYAVSVRPVYPK